MNSKTSEMERLARQLYQSNRHRLDLLAGDKAETAVQLPVDRLFGTKPDWSRSVRLGKGDVRYSRHTKDTVSFLPVRWQDELDRGGSLWSGCENWWAGYPLIAWVSIKAADDGVAGHLKFNAEVGPVSDHKVRKGLIKALTAGACAEGAERIRFPAGATDRGRLYSRFLHASAIDLADIRDTNEVERKLVHLVAAFEPEIELVARAIRQFLDAGAVPAAAR